MPSRAMACSRRGAPVRLCSPAPHVEKKEPKTITQGEGQAKVPTTRFPLTASPNLKRQQSHWNAKPPVPRPLLPCPVPLAGRAPAQPHRAPWALPGRSPLEAHHVRGGQAQGARRRVGSSAGQWRAPGVALSCLGPADTLSAPPSCLPFFPGGVGLSTCAHVRLHKASCSSSGALAVGSHHPSPPFQLPGATQAGRGRMRPRPERASRVPAASLWSGGRKAGHPPPHSKQETHLSRSTTPSMQAPKRITELMSARRSRKRGGGWGGGPAAPIRWHSLLPGRELHLLLAPGLCFSRRGKAVGCRSERPAAKPQQLSRAAGGGQASRGPGDTLSPQAQGGSSSAPQLPLPPPSGVSCL